MSKDKQNDDSDIVRLKEQILRSGFPLEIEIASSLTQQFTTMDADISTSAYYLDKDDGKGRELDIKAFIPIEPLKDESSLVFLNLLVESKNIPGNAWVFFRSPHRIDHSYNCTSVLDALEWVPREHHMFTYSKDLHLHNLPITAVNDEYILDKKTSNKKGNNLFEALVSLAKATSYEYESHKRGFQNLLLTEDLLDLNYIEIFCAAIVFSGEMYLAEEVEKGQNMRLTPVNHVGSYVDYVSGNYDIQLVVDVLHKRALRDFVNMILRDIEIFRKASDGEAGKSFRKELLKARRWYMRKKHVQQ